MAKTEVERKTGLEEALKFSRSLPQLGMPPEINLQNSLSAFLEQSREHPVKPNIKHEKTTKKQNTVLFDYKWGVFSAFSDYLNGKL